MIIDADCHISPTAEGGNSITIDELLKRMDRSGVSKAITWLQPPYRRDLAESNHYVYESSRKHPDRILGFGWADPNLGLENAKDLVKRCIEEYGFYGVKLNGAQNFFPIDDPKSALPLIEIIAAAGSRLALHVGADSYNNTSPYRLEKVARLYPDLPILAVHMGGASFDDMSALVIEVASKCPNVILIGSAVRAISILSAVRALGPERVCYGSDTPFELMHVEVQKYRALFEGEIPDGQFQSVMGGNIRRLFGI